MQSPPARALADYLLKDHKPYLRSGTLCGLDQPGAPGRGKGDGHASPVGASMRSGRALARTSSVAPDDERWRMASLVDRNSFWSSRGARRFQEHSTLPDRFNLYENC